MSTLTKLLSQVISHLIFYSSVRASSSGSSTDEYTFPEQRIRRQHSNMASISTNHSRQHDSTTHWLSEVRGLGVSLWQRTPTAKLIRNPILWLCGLLVLAILAFTGLSQPNDRKHISPRRRRTSAHPANAKAVRGDDFGEQTVNDHWSSSQHQESRDSTPECTSTPKSQASQRGNPAETNSSHNTHPGRPARNIRLEGP